MTNFSSNPKSLQVLDQDLNIESLNKLEMCKSISVDTEAMGLIHGRDRLCLVQICDENDNIIFVKLHIEQTSAPRLKKLMENSSVEKIFHYARFDVAALSSSLKINVSPIFCTKIASKLARTYSPKHGLKDLIRELVGIELDKQEQSSDWGNLKDLTKSQLIYAANDVRYLLKAKERLEEMLKREGRLEIAKSCFDCINTISKLDILRFNHIFDH